MNSARYLLAKLHPIVFLNVRKKLERKRKIISSYGRWKRDSLNYIKWFQLFTPHLFSGVVGWERMGTAFPHKKLSGNGVPTREILRDIFFIIAIKLAIFHCYHVTAFRASQTM